MKKIGRNDKCPCGSGQKQKYCCLEKGTKAEETSMIPPNIYQLITYKYFDEKHINLDEELRKYESEIYDLIPELTKSVSDILKDYINCTEKHIENIASNYTTYEMLFWSRRLGPKNIFNVENLTVMLYREVQNLSFYKYGISDENIITDENFGSSPKNMEEYNKLDYSECLEKLKFEKLSDGISKTISDVIRLEILSFIYVKGTQFYRIANKGGEVIFDSSNKIITSNTSKEISFLIDLYDERLSNSNLFSRTGSYVDNKLDFEEPYFCPHFQLNVDHKVKMKMFNAKNEAYSRVFAKGDEIIEAETNYLLGAYNIVNIFNFLTLFEEEFQKYYSFSVIDFLLFLGCIGYKIVGDISARFDFQYHILNRAYIITNYNLKTFSEEFEMIYPVLHKAVFKTELNHKVDTVLIFKRFLLEKSKKSDIDLWTRGPKRLLYQLSNEHMVVDYTCLTDIISYIVKEITSVDGEVGNRRADYFEDSLKSEINSIYGKEKMWVCRAEITSGKLKKEIDASFVIDDILFIIEAKAVNVSFGFHKGDKLAVDFRSNKMKVALEEANEKAEFILKYKNTLDKKLPDNVMYICPLVISTNPEYIWSIEDDLFISKKLKFPRVITIPDIAKLKRLNLSDLRKKDWVVKL